MHLNDKYTVKINTEPKDAQSIYKTSATDFFITSEQTG